MLLGRLLQLARQLARVAAPLGRQAQSDVGGEVAVLGIARPLQLDGSPGRAGELAGQTLECQAHRFSCPPATGVKSSSSARSSAIVPTPMMMSPASSVSDGDGVGVEAAVGLAHGDDHGAGQVAHPQLSDRRARVQAAGRDDDLLELHLGATPAVAATSR